MTKRYKSGLGKGCLSIFIIVGIALVVSIGSIGTVSAENLVYNGDFEIIDPLDSSNPDGWTLEMGGRTPQMIYDTGNYYSGSHSVLFIGGAYSDKISYGIIKSPLIDTNKGKLTWYQHQSTVFDASDVEYYLKFYDENNNLISDDLYYTDTTTSSTAPDSTSVCPGSEADADMNPPAIIAPDGGPAGYGNWYKFNSEIPDIDTDKFRFEIYIYQWEAPNKVGDGDPCGSWFEARFDNFNIESVDKIIFEDDFDSYVTGLFPSSGGWNLKYDGFGTSYQIIDSSQSKSAPNSLKLEGMSGWAASADHPLSETPDQVIFEADIKVIRVDGGTDGWMNAYVTLIDTDVGWGKHYGSVLFGADQLINGKIPYNFNQWYHIKSKIDMVDRKSDVWIDDEFIGTFDVSSDGYYKGIRLDADNSGHTRAWFDNVKVYLEAAEKDVKIEGTVTNIVYPISFPPIYTINIDGIIDDPLNKFNVGDEVFVSYPWGTTAEIDSEIVIGNNVEVFGAYNEGGYDIIFNNSEHYLRLINQNHPPEIISITAIPTVVGPGESSIITVVASDSDGDILSYIFESTGGTISGSGNVGTWIADTNTGKFTVFVNVFDGKESASGSVDITVTETPSLSVGLSANSPSIKVDESSTIIATVTSSANPVSGAAVSFLGGVTPTSGTTDSNGQVPTTFTSSTIGTYTITATASKSGYGNGIGSIDIIVTEEEKPDLEITELKYEPKSNIEVGGLVKVTSITLQNIGKGDCESPFDVALYINDEWKTSITVVDNLLSGDSKTIDFNYQWQIEGKPYTIKVVADDGGDTIKVVADDGGVIEEDFVVNNMMWESFKPKPWLKITTDKSTYKGDGENVEVKIDFYSPNENEVLDIEERVDGHYEYSTTIDLSTKPQSFSFKIPALPVYNSKKHIISGSILESGDSQGPLEYQAEYFVEPTDDVDMIILTNPWKLYNQFREEDWGDILFDIQKATDDGGILLYANNEDTYSDISKDIYLTNVQPLKYLFILGGDDVIPYQKTKTGNSDYYYWAWTLDHIPELGYGRLPTTASSDDKFKDLDFDLNKKVFETILKNEPNKEKNIASTLLISGRDTEDEWVDEKFVISSDYVKSKLNNEKKVDVLNEYAWDIEWSFWRGVKIGNVISTYEEPDLKAMDLIYFVGHGDTDSISMLNDDEHDSLKSTRASERESLIFYIDDNFINLKTTKSSDNLENLPIIYLNSCKSANHTDNRVSLSEMFLHFGAGSSLGYGKSFRVETGEILTKAYFDQILVKQNLGDIFTNSIHATVGKIKSDCPPKKQTKFLTDLDYVIQFGYPKWNIDPDQPVPDYSNPSMSNNIDFDIINYNVSTSYNATSINFTSILNGDLANSADWMLQGNPIIPYVHSVYDLPEGKTIDSITFKAGHHSELGQYNMTVMPGTYNGPLYEYYPLNLDAYMEQPVEWKIFEKTDGNMTVVIDIFPFQYYPSNDTVIFYNNFTITTSQRDRTASIDSVSPDKRLYLKGDIAEITVNTTGAAQINMTIGDTGSMTQPSSGSNVFTVDTSVATAGSHDIDVKLYDGNSLLDEQLTGISVVDSLINMTLGIPANSTAKGTLLNISILATNLGGTETVVNPYLVIYTDNASRIDLDELTLSSYESKFINTTIDTNNMPSGFATIYTEVEMDTITVNSNYETITVYEDISDIIIEYEIEPKVIRLSFSNPYVDNVQYSIDNSFNTSLFEPYEIDISSLVVGSTHNITVYADDVFGNENSTSFQFVRKSEETDDGSKTSDDSSSGGGGGGGTSGEAFANILISETERENVYKDTIISYSFDMDGNIVRYINFTGLTSYGQVAAKVEILNHTSTLVDHAPQDEVYKNLNLWVGNLGWANSRNIANPTVNFIVEKSWVTENNIDESTIRLNRYSDGTWNPLVTTEISSDSSYLYLEAKTLGFSPFVITGKKVSLPASPGGEGIVAKPAASMEESINQTGTEKKPGVPGFGLFAGLSILLVAVEILKKKK